MIYWTLNKMDEKIIIKVAKNDENLIDGRVGFLD